LKFVLLKTSIIGLSLYIIGIDSEIAEAAHLTAPPSLGGAAPIEKTFVDPFKLQPEFELEPLVPALALA
jgi:hypothetical protein